MRVIEHQIKHQYPITVDFDESNAWFTVIYGHESFSTSDYAQAAHVYGEYVFHAANCQFDILGE